MERLEDMINIGKVLAGQLLKVGICTPDELKEIGARDAWLRIQAIDKSACIHRLYSLEGAIEGIKKTQLDYETKVALKQFYLDHKL